MTCALPLAQLGLSPDGFRKINQYLDATRAAVLFARRIILVEGIAEAVLLPILARMLVFASDRPSNATSTPSRSSTSAASISSRISGCCSARLTGSPSLTVWSSSPTAIQPLMQARTRTSQKR